MPGQPEPGRAVVVGGASGIGAAVADRLRAEGSTVVVWDVREPHDVRCDVADPDDVIRATSVTIDRIGVPRTLTITAGIGHAAPLADADPTDWDRVLTVNARGPWLVMRALSGPMTQKGGSMVAVSSVSARLADRGMGLYCASKAALEMVVKVAAAEWGPAIRVNAVAPGVTDTPMLGPIPRTGPWLSGVAARTALGRIGDPGDVAETVLAVHRLPWVSGSVLTCDGGLSLHSPIDPGAPAASRSPSSG